MVNRFEKNGDLFSDRLPRYRYFDFGLTRRDLAILAIRRNYNGP